MAKILQAFPFGNDHGAQNLAFSDESLSRLENVGYVFQETGIVSKDKLLSSGQTGQVAGQIMGIYLFRAAE